MSLERSPDFSRDVLEEVYRYRMKRPRVAWAIWLVTGVLGGHRFYLGKTLSGLVMLGTGGLGGIWWIADAFFLRRMVREYNDRQSSREDAGLPPIEMEFMPAIPTDRELEGAPVWAHLRDGRARLAGDALVLLIAGVALGAVTASRGDFEALAAVLALIAITVLGARWDPTLPLLGQLDRWSHRLRLYYRFNDPGGPLSLMFRPMVGPLTAWFRKKARAEVRLYLQLGAVFTIGFTLLDLIQAASGGGFDGGALAGDLFFTFIVVYAFCTPIGAILTTHILLERRDEIVWALSGLTVVAIGMGLL
ncbi:MAG: TM2 domain-containing protein [Gemmatimonadota bacterium]|nr:TM2 domain-containing protein [Gemmatimonadota bacterium]MDH3424222.1 TM2 domain-containing protein [Gemmatimonadota bacterium]